MAAFAAGKFGLCAVAQSAARKLGPQGVRVAHLIIDAGVDTPFVRDLIKKNRGIDAADLPADTLLNPAPVGEAYWMLHHQPRDAWNFGVVLRPFRETW